MSPRSTTPVDQKIGARILAARRAKGLTQTDFGELIGVTFQQVQKYENGANRLNGSRITRVTEVLGVTVNWLLTGADEKDHAGIDVLVRMGGVTGGIQLASAYVGLTPSKRRLVLDMAQGLGK